MNRIKCSLLILALLTSNLAATPAPQEPVYLNLNSALSGSRLEGPIPVSPEQIRLLQGTEEQRQELMTTICGRKRFRYTIPTGLKIEIIDGVADVPVVMDKYEQPIFEFPGPGQYLLLIDKHPFEEEIRMGIQPMAELLEPGFYTLEELRGIIDFRQHGYMQMGQGPLLPLGAHFYDLNSCDVQLAMELGVSVAELVIFLSGVLMDHHGRDWYCQVTNCDRNWTLTCYHYFRASLIRGTEIGFEPDDQTDWHKAQSEKPIPLSRLRSPSTPCYLRSIKIGKHFIEFNPVCTIGVDLYSLVSRVCINTYRIFGDNIAGDSLPLPTIYKALGNKTVWLEVRRRFDQGMLEAFEHASIITLD